MNKSDKINFIVRLGDEIKHSGTNLKEAMVHFDKLPDGTGKSWSKRRSISKEVTLREDEGIK